MCLYFFVLSASGISLATPKSATLESSKKSEASHLEEGIAIIKVNFYTIVSMISVDAAKVQPLLRGTRRMRKCAGWWKMRLARQGEEKSAIVAEIES